jgi:hypothetical protein
MKSRRKQSLPLHKKAQRGFRGYPVATVAFYGPDDTCATKVAVGIMRREAAEPAVLERWASDAEDVRYSATIEVEILRFVQSQGVQSVVMVDRIIGCPHEEGTEYPRGAKLTAVPVLGPP